MTKFNTSYENTYITDFAQNSHCLNLECLLSHNLSDVDENNFGRHYTEKLESTQLFPRICKNCLRAKFGIYESNSQSLTLLNCEIIKNLNMSANKIDEGLFLKACKPVKNLLVQKEIVFNKHTLILPVGQILMEILMSNTNVLFNINKNIPKITVKAGKNFYTLTLNPYLYAYFKHLHDIRSHPMHYSQKLSKDSYSTLDDYLWCNNFNPKNIPLEATYEVDALMISNIIAPLASLSRYVESGESTKLQNSKTVYGTIRDRDITEFSSENNHDIHNIIHELEIDNLKERIYTVKERKIQFLNQVLADNLLTMKQLFINRKQYLLDLFEEVSYKTHSAIGLHVASFCLPEKIIHTKFGHEFRQYNPNVKWIEGVGLISTRDICLNDLFIIDMKINMSNYIKMKVNVYKDYFSFNDLHLPHVEESGTAILKEGRETGLIKECIYKHL